MEYGFQVLGWRKGQDTSLFLFSAAALHTKYRNLSMEAFNNLRKKKITHLSAMFSNISWRQNFQVQPTSRTLWGEKIGLTMSISIPNNHWSNMQWGDHREKSWLIQLFMHETTDWIYDWRTVWRGAHTSDKKMRKSWRKKIRLYRPSYPSYIIYGKKEDVIFFFQAKETWEI